MLHEPERGQRFQRYMSLNTRSGRSLEHDRDTTDRTPLQRRPDRAFLNGNGTVDYHPQDWDGACEFVRRTLVRIGHDRLRRPDKGAVRKYLAKTTGLSRAQVTRLIAQYRETGQVADRRQRNSGRPFERVYTINVALSGQELALRREAQQLAGWQPAQPRPRKISASLKAYAKLVISADLGVVRDLSQLD